MAAKNYEAMLVFSVKNGDEAAQQLFEKFKALIEKHGTIENVDEWGKRKLAYDINYESEGYYYVVDYSESQTAFSVSSTHPSNHRRYNYA